MNWPVDFESVTDESSFQRRALEVFRLQASEVKVYGDYLSAIGIRPEQITTWEQIPYLPVELFKKHSVRNGKEIQQVFSSSGTTGERSRHEVADLSIYERSFALGFKGFYGDISEYCLLALLPGYYENTSSSLLYMVSKLIAGSGHFLSGYYDYADFDRLADVLAELRGEGQKTILWGIPFALLDFCGEHAVEFPELIVMETGGMKGRRKELVREELHLVLQKALKVPAVHSEYGMTELLSQAYSQGHGVYRCPSWMRVRIREVNDPFSFCKTGKTGGVCITDLANIHSCAFIAVQDLGRLREDGSFEVLGRFDSADQRGCNLMVE
jgi:phenylacetate-coenzyme A ligase PaaK-like adenylate-forming protein